VVTNPSVNDCSMNLRVSSGRSFSSVLMVAKSASRCS
jgi:hypothetical protein